MKTFFKNLLSSKSSTSSKRFISLIALVNLVALTWVATFSAESKVTPEFMFEVMAMLAGAGLGLTSLEKIFESKNNKTNTTDSEEVV